MEKVTKKDMEQFWQFSNEENGNYHQILSRMAGRSCNEGIPAVLNSSLVCARELAQRLRTPLPDLEQIFGAGRNRETAARVEKLSYFIVENYDFAK